MNADVPDEALNSLSHAVIGAAIEVHRRLGPGLLESVYRRCLAHELRKRGHTAQEEQPVTVIYDDLILENAFRADVFVDERLIVEVKAKRELHPIDFVQTTSYLRLMNLRLGLIVNFHVRKLTDGVHRIINGYDCAPPDDTPQST